MWLLRLFPAFRMLEADLAATSSARIRAEDDTRLWRARAESAEAERDKAQVAHSAALKQVANWQSLSMGNPNVPFPEVFIAAPRPPEVEGPQGPPKRLARDVMNERNLQARAASFQRLHEVTTGE